MQKNNLVKAINKNVRTGARKANLVLNFIKGKKADVAIRDLEFTRKKVALDIKKTVKSAIANAENNYQYDIDNLYVKEAYVMNLSSNINSNDDLQLNAGSYQRQIFNSDESYEGQVDDSWFGDNEPNGYGIFSFTEEYERINVIGKWDDNDTKNGLFILIDETDITTLIYRNDILVETSQQIDRGFGKDEISIQQINFDAYWESYGEKQRPVRKKSKQVIIKRLKDLKITLR